MLSCEYMCVSPSNRERRYKTRAVETFGISIIKPIKLNSDKMVLLLLFV